jgi:hypothetical protein
MKKIYERPELNIVSINNNSNVMLTTSTATTGKRGIYGSKITFGSLK